MRHLSADNTIGMKAVCCSIMLAFAVVAANASRTADALSPADFEIASLPGLESPLGFKQYSGFMPLGDAAGTELFFWFVESQNSPGEILWSTEPHHCMRLAIFLRCICHLDHTGAHPLSGRCRVPRLC